MRELWWLAALACACGAHDTQRVSTIQPVRQDAAPVRPVATAPATPAPLSEDMAAPYWTDGDALAGANAFALEDFKTARASFAAARAKATDPARAARLDLMLGLCDEQLGDNASAAKELVAARAGIPELADYIGYHAARALELAHQPGALELARSVAKDSIVGPDAEILVGDLLRDTQKWPDVIAHYRAYLAHHPDGPFRSEARFDLASAIEQVPGVSAGPDSHKESVALYRQIEIDDPLSPWATQAHDRLTALGLPETFTGPEHLAQGMVLFAAMRNPESEAAFAAALADPKLTPKQACEAAYYEAQSRFKARDRKGAAPMFDAAITTCTKAGDTDLEVKASYQAGRSYAYTGDHKTAVARYQAAETIDPAHSYSDDAMLREAEEWASLGDMKKVQDVLSALPTKFPHGDTVPEALWRLGWQAWRDKRYDDAIGWWQKQATVVPHEDGYNGVFGDFADGEAHYWIGRAYAAKKQMKDAIAAWQETVRTSPAAYYALMALNRLREADPRAYDAMVAEISADPPGYDPKAPAFSFEPRVEWGTPGFHRAMELLRLGLGKPAERELKKLGLTAPAGKHRVTDPDEIDKLWALAYLDDRAGRYADSIWPTRWHVLDYRLAWPVGANRARWLIAYPKAYWELLSRHAKLNDVPIAMQIGIVREESGFDPLDESYANAVGLTQMIPPTAHDFAKGTGIDPTRENLRDPEKNVTIGSRFLGSLFKRWNNFTLLVPTSYNAGPAAVRRMLLARGTWDADEFVEGIVDDQARNYTKRVLGTFFTYTWLYQHEVPVIPNTIPKDLLPAPPKAEKPAKRSAKGHHKGRRASHKSRARGK